ncbi:MAG: hypothetical protein K0S67_358 [Nitrososphaeraceae archaeon]|jgi:hypothetical protein|nr:hypothetical protein [Nitrososphaeraceae archaeon]MCD6036474.1 hypothetical protein [Nitrososphaeraceae archaeon]MDF2769314.1 hypothetical protein [Nitrososphaeraceae archaeon]
MLIMTGTDNVGLDQAELSAAAVIAIEVNPQVRWNVNQV